MIPFFVKRILLPSAMIGDLARLFVLSLGAGAAYSLGADMVGKRAATYQQVATLQANVTSELATIRTQVANLHQDVLALRDGLNRIYTHIIVTEDEIHNPRHMELMTTLGGVREQLNLQSHPINDTAELVTHVREQLELLSGVPQAVVELQDDLGDSVDGHNEMVGHAEAIATRMVIMDDRMGNIESVMNKVYDDGAVHFPANIPADRRDSSP